MTKKFEVTLSDPDGQFYGLINKIRERLRNNDIADVVVDPGMSEEEGGKDHYIIKKDDAFSYPDREQKVTFRANDADNTLMRLIEKLKKHSDPGHSFSVVVDPDVKQADGGNKSFGMDGDGSFRIKEIKKTYKKDKVANLISDEIIKQASPKSQVDGVIRHLKRLHSGELAEQAKKEALRAEDTFRKFDAKVGDNPKFSDTMNEIRRSMDVAKKNAKRTELQTTAVKAAPFIAAGSLGAVVSREAMKSPEKTASEEQEDHIRKPVSLPAQAPLP